MNRIINSTVSCSTSLNTNLVLKFQTITLQLRLLLPMKLSPMSNRRRSTTANALRQRLLLRPRGPRRRQAPSSPTTKTRCSFRCPHKSSPPPSILRPPSQRARRPSARVQCPAAPPCQRAGFLAQPASLEAHALRGRLVARHSHEARTRSPPVPRDLLATSMCYEHTVALFIN